MANRRIGEFNKGIGEAIATLEGTEVTVTSVSFETRVFEGEEKPLTLLTLKDGALYHSWSEAVKRAFENVPVNAYPIDCTFKRVRTRANRETWVVE